MKDIGSIFPLYNKDLVADSETTTVPVNRIHFSLCREALYIIAESLSKTNKTVLLPAYTCDSVFLPFKQLGWKCVFYSIHKDLLIDTNSLIGLAHQYQPALVIAHPYFGMELNDLEIKTLQQLKTPGTKILIDNTQCVFSSKHFDFADYYVGSYRKWFPIPDGGYLESKLLVDTILLKTENTIFVAAEKGAMFLRGQYFETDNEDIKRLSISLSKAADLQSVGTIVPHRMSTFSEIVLSKQDYSRNQKKRIENYTYLHKHLNQETIKFASHDIERVTTAPLYFPIYVKKRADLQRYLAKHHIYLPIIWPVDHSEVLINDTIRYIYDHILCIPVDQRYNTEDMEKVVHLINQF